MRNRLPPRIVGMLLAAGIATMLAGCGKKSELDAPPGEKGLYPRVYPKPDAPPPLAQPQAPQPDALTLPPSPRLPGTLPQ